MKSLFTKIFLWFWASLALLVVISYGMTQLVNRDSRNIVRNWGDPFAIFATYAREAVQNEGRPGLEEFLQRVESGDRLDPDRPPGRAKEGERRTSGGSRGRSRPRPELLVVDRQGRELRGRAVPAGTDAAVREALAGRASGLLQVRGRDYFVYSLGGAADLDSSVLLVTPPPRRRVPIGLPHDASVIAVLIGIGGVLCFALAWHLTSPVSRLRRAVAGLAGGDLSARVAGAPALGGDEITSLGRDFNLMAERIESLVTSHKRLLSDVSHELRSPLARIRVALGLAEPAASESVQPFLQRIEREAERLETLIGQILTLSRLESGAGPVYPERFDLVDLVRDVAEDARFEAAANGVGVLFDPQGEIFVMGEVSALRSAIENVVRNAVRASPTGGTVEIASRIDGEGDRRLALLTVCDRGPGLPENELETMFDAFTRGERSRDRQSGGAGLGLAIARRALESHGGRIRAALREGGGLLVEMQLPLETTESGPMVGPRDREAPNG